MLTETIRLKASEWLAAPECKVKSVVEYIRKAGKLRQPQIEAIEVYLYLKIAGGNNPLRQLLSEGFFLNGVDLDRLNLSVESRNILNDSLPARAIFELVRKKAENISTHLSPAERLIAENASRIDFASAAKSLFYEVEYPDYLFSLPMGAGKTFLMAAIMYLDLYFAENEPNNQLFAHNFLVLVPSGLKSSIVPSLKTIEKFDPSWVIPEPAAANLKRLIKFEVLDEAKSAKKSNKAKNPNVQKIARHQPFDDLTGLVMIVNAEKVILERLELDKQGHLFVKTEDEKYQHANELRNFISKIPNLQIHIDEVHHATDSDVKLRQVVNKWSGNGNVNGVLGYSGTPYLEKKEKFIFGDNISFVSEQITNTVYYYSLVDGIKSFLKKPTIKSEERGLQSLQIIRKGVDEFREKFGSLVYADGTIAKLAIYCGTIERLEEEVFPFLTGEMKIPAESILKFHKGNKEHPQPTDSGLEFKLIDEPVSRKQIILLVQIGKEGWDCRSLTGVILSQQGDCPKNMVLQTSCRCLREVERGKNETALVWLSKDNAETLNKQLAEKQSTSIAEINKISKTKDKDMLERFSRIDYLKLPRVDYFQLKVEYDTVVTGDAPDHKRKIAEIDANKFYSPAIVKTRSLVSDLSTTAIHEIEKGAAADFNRWLLEISKESFGSLSVGQLSEFTGELRKIFQEITVGSNGSAVFNEFYDMAEINKQIRLAFHNHRELETKRELIPSDARLLIVECLQSISKPKNYLPNETETKEILEIDAEGLSIESKIEKRREEYEKAAELLKAGGLGKFLPNIPNGYSMNVTSKDRSFHFLPYHFDSSLEKRFLENALTLDALREKKLEIYFNGEDHLTEFKISCYSGSNYVGAYYPDFLVIQREKKKIERILIVETKGGVYANAPRFQHKKKFTESEFLKINNGKFKYKKFDYLYLSDDDPFDDNLVKFNNKIREFFAD